MVCDSAAASGPWKNASDSSSLERPVEAGGTGPLVVGLILARRLELVVRFELVFGEGQILTEHISHLGPRAPHPGRQIDTIPLSRASQLAYLRRGAERAIYLKVPVLDRQGRRGHGDPTLIMPLPAEPA